MKITTSGGGNHLSAPAQTAATLQKPVVQLGRPARPVLGMVDAGRCRHPRLKSHTTEINDLNCLKPSRTVQRYVTMSKKGDQTFTEIRSFLSDAGKTAQQHADRGRPWMALGLVDSPKLYGAAKERKKELVDFLTWGHFLPHPGSSPRQTSSAARRQNCTAAI